MNKFNANAMIIYIFVFEFKIITSKMIIININELWNVNKSHKSNWKLLLEANLKIKGIQSHERKQHNHCGERIP